MKVTAIKAISYYFPLWKWMDINKEDVLQSFCLQGLALHHVADPAEFFRGQEENTVLFLILNF